MNRRIRNRTYGGVGGGAPQGPLLPDVRQAWRVCAFGHELIGGGQPISDLEVEVLYGPW